MPDRVKEKLVELLEKASHECDDFYDLWDMRQVVGDIADFLTAHSVMVQDNAEISDKLLQQLRNAPLTILHEEPTVEVVQEWISVKDRLPNRDDMVIAFYPTMRGTSGEMQIHKAWAISETCTHWMPLPQPPKGE